MSVRVLIADSSGEGREVMRHHLDCMGCDVIAETDNAVQTANLFRTVHPQVVILDSALKTGGDLDALGLVRMIRHDSPDTAIIAVIPASDAERAREFTDEGALECLVQPFLSGGFERVWRKLLMRFPELARWNYRTQKPRAATAAIERNDRAVRSPRGKSKQGPSPNLLPCSEESDRGRGIRRLDLPAVLA